MPVEPVMSESDSMALYREEYTRRAREAIQAHGDLPAVGIPAELGDVARTSVEASQELVRAARRSVFTVNIDLRALEAARREREERARQAARRTGKRKRGARKRA